MRTCAICAVGLIASRTLCEARGSSSSERPWAAEHVDNLPPDIRRGLAARGSAYGNSAAAGRYFSVSIDVRGLRFRSLHFEDFACDRRTAVCNAAGCLHEVYVESRGRQRLVFSVYARDLKMTGGGAAVLQVLGPSSSRFYRWDGRPSSPPTMVPAKGVRR